MSASVEVLVCNPNSRIEASPMLTVIDTWERDVHIEIEQRDRDVFEVRALRGVGTSNEVYYRVADGSIKISDNFRTLLATVPLHERAVPDDAVVDHLLFRTRPGRGTYCEGIRRLGHGEELTWTAGSGPVVERRRRLARAAFETTPSQAIDRALADELDRAGDAVNMLSGGIDSTLIHTYLEHGHPSMSVSVDSPEFAFEVAYAEEASALVGSRHTLVHLEEAAYLEALEETIRRLGLPPHHLQTVVMDASFQSDHGAYISGQFADGLFGLGSTHAALTAWGASGTGRAVLGLRSLAKRALGRESELGSVNAQLRRDVLDPFGFASQFAVYTDMKAMWGLVGRAAVARRLEARRDYVLELVEVEGAGTVFGHLHLGHWIDFYCDDAVSLWRQSAHAHGKALHAPFATAALAEIAYSVPPERRYRDGSRTKYLLKDLLAHRLPAYDVDKRKGASGLPVSRYLAAGPLTGAVDRYALPANAESLMSSARGHWGPWLEWNFLTLAMWHQLVLMDATLAPPDRCRRVGTAA